MAIRRPRALQALMPLVYDEMRRLAHRYLRRERPGHTLQSTALVHEAFVRLTGNALPNGKIALISSALRPT